MTSNCQDALGHTPYMHATLASISLGVEKVAKIGQVEYQNGKWNWKWEK